jgi:hypothetical protein
MNEWSGCAWNLIFRNSANEAIFIEAKRKRFFVKRIHSEEAGKFKQDIEAALDYANELAKKNGGWKVEVKRG